MNCASCKAILPEGAVFCPSCGNRVAPKPYTEMDEWPETGVLLSIFQEADRYEQKDDYQAELRVLSKGIRIAPNNCTLMLRMGRAFWRLGYDQKALDYYRKAERLNPLDPIVYVNIAALYISRGMYAEAKPYFEKGIGIIEKEPLSASVSDTAVTYGNYALCVGELGDIPGAKKYLSLAKKNGYRRESLETICGRLHINPNEI
ncbi:MAG: hypothetical protein K5746_06230 [Clostridiales bacterium]|nr:hypothetical protein [Clostridiales bacterium]